MSNTLNCCLPELEKHTSLLFPFGDHLESVQAAVTPLAVAAAECDEMTVKAIVPGAIFVHVPQTVFVTTGYKTRPK